MPKKRVFDIELVDTRAPFQIEGHNVTVTRAIHKGTAKGSYPKQALKAFAKTLPKTINFGEMRDSQYARYIFEWKERK